MKVVVVVKVEVVVKVVVVAGVAAAVAAPVSRFVHQTRVASRGDGEDTNYGGLSVPDALAEVFSVGFEWEWDEETDTARGCDRNCLRPFLAWAAANRETPAHTLPKMQIHATPRSARPAASHCRTSLRTAAHGAHRRDRPAAQQGRRSAHPALRPEIIRS